MSRILPGPGDLWAGPDSDDDGRARDAWEADPDGAAADHLDYAVTNDWNDPDFCRTFDTWLASDDADLAFEHHRYRKGR